MVTTSCLGMLTKTEIPSSARNVTPVVPTAGDVSDTDTITETNTVKPRFTNASDHERFGLRRKFSERKGSRMTYCVSSYEHASRQHRGAISWEYQRRQYS